MQGIRQRAGRSVRAREVARTGTGWFCLILAATLPQAVGVSPAIAQHGLAAPDASDTILAWGDNNDGELGDGTTTDSSTPVEVSLPAGTTVTAIAAGHDHSLAVTSAGTALAWGDNRFGQLGDETTTDSITPVDVSLLAGTTVTAIAAGDDHSFAVTSAGAALAWGDNDRGELGDGTTTRSSTPVPVSLPAGTTVTAIAGGIAHGLALTSAGKVLAWGLNSDGQLGDGTTADSSTPVEVSLPAGTTVTAIGGGR
ncbi:chromosome condensation regulator RCC1, partial [Salinispora cortesiana]|uniref:RCC1 domain-containing protein n=1 Tax=Salinispora cortesiana TaxID=1305843 RepID=UPI00046FE439